MQHTISSDIHFHWMKLRAAVETGNTSLWYGRFIDLPGTHARAGAFDQLLVELSEEASYHDLWLRHHGEEPLNLDDFTVEVAERVDNVEMLGESGGEMALFSYDLEEVTEAHLERCLRYMGYHRMDLHALLEGVDAETLKHTPPGKGRNITQILGHICNAEEWYLSRLGLDAEQAYERNLGIHVSEADELPIFERMSLVREAAIKTLRETLPRKKVVFTRAEYTVYPDERWSARKVLRRFLEHEREHIYNIRWYLGLPERGFP
jgi:uncharacterized damage-inducible protein DinB